ncbi:FadR/GntR family transcriptional regulator [Paraburkholderia youngii]|uniref:Pyruvate dehydrogenase complex repressor n=1 Tax=Paraburkholderia youngii TaxID=2782701 RepID=A0A7Y6K2R6_9BURK|nr:FadR/GntR family transcriptional regulator [Paraburkholderia youngii]NUY02408.1 FadR family transcriptional regulator [Paraburkholderia youngii]
MCENLGLHGRSTGQSTLQTHNQRPEEEKRLMSYTPIVPPTRFRLSDAICQQLEQLIVDGKLRGGESLPSERDLAQQLNVSRPSLREALLRLEGSKLLRAKTGGGYVIADPSAPLIAEPLAHLMARHRKAAGDILEMRGGLEAIAAELAAVRATKSDIKKIKSALDALDAAFQQDNPYAVVPGQPSLPLLDATFHLQIAEATHNIVLIHVMHGLHNLVQRSIEETYSAFEKHDADLSHLINQHRRIYDAIQQHDPVAARNALVTHLSFIRENATR